MVKPSKSYEHKSLHYWILWFLRDTFDQPHDIKILDKINPYVIRYLNEIIADVGIS